MQRKYPGWEHLSSVSRKIHWYVESKVEKDHQDSSAEMFLSRHVPYLDFRSARTEFSALALPEFITSIADEGSGSPLTESELADYTRYLEVLKSASKRRSASGYTSTLILNNTAQGGLQYAFVENISDLFVSRTELIRKHERTHERPYEMRHEFVRDRSFLRDHARRLHHERGRDR